VPQALRRYTLSHRLLRCYNQTLENIPLLQKNRFFTRMAAPLMGREGSHRGSTWTACRQTAMANSKTLLKNRLTTIMAAVTMASISASVGAVLASSAWNRGWGVDGPRQLASGRRLSSLLPVGCCRNQGQWRRAEVVWGFSWRISKDADVQAWSD